MLEFRDYYSEVVNKCTGCNLCETRTKAVFGEGNEHADVMFIGEAPGYNEDRLGRPFVGRAGQLLDKLIATMGYQRSQVYITNIVKCRPPSNRNPEANEVAACAKYLESEIRYVKPKVIIALGACAGKRLLGDSFRISRERGRFQKYNNLPVLPTYHPAYLLRNPAATGDVESDMQKVLKFLEE